VLVHRESGGARLASGQVRDDTAALASTQCVCLTVADPPPGAPRLFWTSFHKPSADAEHGGKQSGLVRSMP